jgi:UDP-N-acetyl-D-mannosaminuronic acid dehydrogenase
MIRKFNTCAVIGIGYIGLPTAAVMAQSGIKVTGVDINARLVDEIRNGRCESMEPGLASLVADAVAKGFLTADTRVPNADVYIIAVPTPFDGGFKPDLSYVRAAALSVAPVLRRGALVVVESTIPVGATEQVARWLTSARPDLRFSRRTGSTGPADVLVAHSPERILPGQMLRELVANDRVIGGVCSQAAQTAAEFYRGFVKGQCITTDSRTAELCKLTENSYRDVNIAFANELASICDETNVDVWELIDLANRHPRVNILRPGPGVGGHCIAVDPWFIVSQLADKSRLIREARWINSARPRQVVAKVLEACKQSNVRRVSCLGLAYKADVDDFRESPAVEVTAELVREIEIAGLEVRVQATDPNLKGPLPPALAEQNIEIVDLETALQAELIVLLVDHREFAAIPEARLVGKMVIDTRGLWPFARTARAWTGDAGLVAAE